MAISKEDKADVKNAMGKALANKVGKVTRDDAKSYLKQKREGYMAHSKEHPITASSMGSSTLRYMKKLRKNTAIHAQAGEKYPSIKNDVHDLNAEIKSEKSDALRRK